LEVTTELDEKTDGAEGPLHRINERRAVGSTKCLGLESWSRDARGEDAHEGRSRRYVLGRFKERIASNRGERNICTPIGR
jgi:hypothetical protein